jgi:hypothetical protein
MLESTQVKTLEMKGRKKLGQLNQRPLNNREWCCNPRNTEVDSSIRRYRARFCKAIDFASAKLTTTIERLAYSLFD